MGALSPTSRLGARRHLGRPQLWCFRSQRLTMVLMMAAGHRVLVHCISTSMEGPHGPGIRSGDPRVTLRCTNSYPRTRWSKKRPDIHRAVRRVCRARASPCPDATGPRTRSHGSALYSVRCRRFGLCGGGATFFLPFLGVHSRIALLLSLSLSLFLFLSCDYG